MLETSNHEITPGKLAAVVNVVRSIHNVCRKIFHTVTISVYNSRTYLEQTVYWSMQTVYWSMQTVYWSMQTVYWSMQPVSSTHSKLALGIFLSSVERTVVPELLNFIGSIVPEIPVKQGMQSVPFSSRRLLSTLQLSCYTSHSLLTSSPALFLSLSLSRPLSPLPPSLPPPSLPLLSPLPPSHTTALHH